MQRYSFSLGHKEVQVYCAKETEGCVYSKGAPELETGLQVHVCLGSDEGDEVVPGGADTLGWSATPGGKDMAI